LAIVAILPAVVLECPRCGHRCAEPATECLACGVIIAKARPAGVRRANGANEHETKSSFRSWPAFVSALLMHEERADATSLAGRCALLLILVPWTWSFAVASVASNAAGQSWLHLVNLPFHEAGHILFLPFGAFLAVLGGSLMQLLVPVTVMTTFLTRHRDPFGAAVAWWWCGENLVDLAPYIGDARALRLVLLGGRTGAEVEGHDWERILMTLGWLHLDHAIARLAHVAGILIMLSALIWGARLLVGHWRRSRADQFPSSLTA
jgi:hypothetical protein